jgi:hypothetical protein
MMSTNTEAQEQPREWQHSSIRPEYETRYVAPPEPSPSTEATALKDTHAALNDLLGFVLHAWPEVRRYGIYERCLLRLAMNREVLEDAPLSGNFYKEAEALLTVHRETVNP